MTNIFEKYGKYNIVFANFDNYSEVIKTEFTLNDLASALEEQLYPKFKERYDREMIGAKKAQDG